MTNDNVAEMQNKREYTALQWMMYFNSQLPTDQKLNIEGLRDVRNLWDIDLASQSYRPSHLRALAQLVQEKAGVDPQLFETVLADLNSTETVVSQQREYYNKYDALVEKNMFPNSSIDPDFQSIEAFSENKRKAYLYTHDGSIRGLQSQNKTNIEILDNTGSVISVINTQVEPTAESNDSNPFDEVTPGFVDDVIGSDSTDVVDVDELQRQASIVQAQTINAREFNVMQWMIYINGQIPATQKLQLSDFRRVRSEWDVNLEERGYKPSDLRNLADSMGDVAGISNLSATISDLNSIDAIKEKQAVFAKAYADRVGVNMYPTSTADPLFQDEDGFTSVSVPYLYTKDASLREHRVDNKRNIEVLDGKGTVVSVLDSMSTSIAESNDFDDEIESSDVIVGWNGRKGENKAPGMKDIIGAYLSGPDIQVASRLFDKDIEIKRDDAYKSVELLRYLRSNGLDFSLDEGQSKNVLEVSLNGLSGGEVRPNTKLRIFDEKPQYIGRVYDSFNSYYFISKDPKSPAAPTITDIKNELDFIMGKRGGTISMASTTDSSTVLDFTENNINKFHIKPIEHRFDTIVFNSKDDAEDYIKNSIDDVAALFKTEFNYDDLKTSFKEYLSVIREEVELNRLSDEGKDVDFDEYNVKLQKATAKINDSLSFVQGVRDLQSDYISDIMKVTDMYVDGSIDFINASMLSTIDADDINDIDLFDMIHSGIEINDDDLVKFMDDVYNKVMTNRIGSFESGFEPAFIIDNVQSSRRNVRESMMAAIKLSDYDLTKIKGNDFSSNAVKDRLIKFDPSTAKSIDDESHTPMMKRALESIQDTLVDGGFKGENGSKPEVLIDDNGIAKWTAVRQRGQYNSNKRPEVISGEVGQIVVPDENGIIKTKFGSGDNYGIVPGYTGFFSFEGNYGDENRMDRFRVKGFEESLQDQVKSIVRGQMLRPYVSALNNIPTTLDSSSLNGLYHGDVYGKRVPLDFVESSNLNKETVNAILKTLSNRVRFDNQYSEHATTSAATRAEQNRINEEDEAAFSYFKAAGEKNMRILDSDLTNYADLTMTGTGKTQGLIWYLTDGAEVQKDGSVKPSAGMYDADGNLVPDKTALQKLDYFKYHDYNAWDRNQMAANQLMTALHVDENVGTALMDFGGWTFDDSYAASLAFAERNYVPGASVNEENKEAALHALEVFKSAIDGETISDFRNQFKPTERTISDALGMKLPYTNKDFLDLYEIYEASLNNKVSKETFDTKLNEFGSLRKMQRGDKISDFGGNKGTLGIVIDPNMDPVEAEAQNLTHEVAIMKANPWLDIVGAPYSMLSRDNAGVVLELMDSETKHVYDPIEGKNLKGAVGSLNVIVTDLTVDHKTHAYTQEDIASGKGRKASGQLAWALQSKDADLIMNEIYGDNVGPWSTFREYLITTGMDMKADGTLLTKYTPQAGEIRNEFSYDSTKTGPEFLSQIREQGGFLNVPFEMKFKNGSKCNTVEVDGQTMSQIPVLSANLRNDTELIDGRMRSNDFTNQYVSIYENIGVYLNNKDKIENFKGDLSKPNVKKNYDIFSRDRDKAKALVEKSFDKIQSEIIDRQFNGGHNGKHSFIRDKIMGKRMTNSATAVAIVDPRLNIGEASMNSAMMTALGVKKDDPVMAWRDPSLRDGAVRGMTVIHDESVHGIALNPISDKSHDMDFDGDTMGLIKLLQAAAKKQLMEKFGHQANMLDYGAGRNKDGQFDLYFQSGMDLASAEAKALSKGDTTITDLYNSAKTNANSDDPKRQQKALSDLNKYSHEAFRKYGFGGDYVRLDGKQEMVDSFVKMVKNGAKGNAGKFVELMDYFGYEVESDESKLKSQIESGHVPILKEHPKSLKTLTDAQNIQEATGVKSDDTGLAGGFSQKLVAALRDGDMKASLEMTYPITQATLQIKHDPRQAKRINNELSSSLNNMYAGKSADGKKKEITVREFKDGMTSVLKDKLGVNFNSDYLDKIAELMSDNGKGFIKPLKEIAIKKGSPLDQVAYGGGYNRLNELAKNNRSLLEGERSKQFAPDKMKTATESTLLIKQDLLDKTRIRETEANLDKPLPKEKVTVDLSNVNVSKSSYDLEP